MDKLVNQMNIGGETKLVVSSRQIAEDFGKEHRVVVRAIENKASSLTEQNCSVENLFIPTTYNHNGNEYKEYLLTRDGFTFIVMGFTGAKADAWKLKYIEAFNEMEKALTKPKALSPKEELKLHYAVLEEHEEKLTQIDNKIDDLEKNMPLFNIECKELQAAVRKMGTMILGGKESLAYRDRSLRTKVYADIQYQLKRQFGVTRYEAIKRGQFEKALQIVKEYQVPLILEDKIALTNNQLVLGDEVC